jgi:nicotinate-nucleotide pyrophosphorylase (carboxylating)
VTAPDEESSRVSFEYAANEHTLNLVRMALAEDVGHGDATSLATVGEGDLDNAVMVARKRIIVSGLDVAGLVFQTVDPSVEFETTCSEGDAVEEGAVIATVSGPSRSLLTAERTALNFMQHLSGIATLTAQYVKAVEGTNARIVDTRKTIPGFRALAKAAVRAGGGSNHRFGLDDGILIKDNHVLAAGGILAAIKRARTHGGYLLRIEVECDTLGQVSEALKAGADALLLDNMSLEHLREAVERCRGRARTEASGGINLSTVRGVAETGVDFISVGALTHSAPAADIALDFEI